MSHPTSPTQGPNDGALALRAQAGDIDAFEQLVIRYQKPLAVFLRYYAPHHQEIEDVVQETFVSVYVHLHQFDAQRNFKPWLYTIARNLLSKTKRRLATLEATDEIASDELEPDTRLSEREEQGQLWRQIREATTDQEFQRLWLHYSERMPVSEIALLFGESQGACKMRLSRLRKKLKPHLQPFIQDDVNFFFRATPDRKAG